MNQRDESTNDNTFIEANKQHTQSSTNTMLDYMLKQQKSQYKKEIIVAIPESEIGYFKRIVENENARRLRARNRAKIQLESFKPEMASSTPITLKRGRKRGVVDPHNRVSLEFRIILPESS